MTSWRSLTKNPCTWVFIIHHHTVPHVFPAAKYDKFQNSAQALIHIYHKTLLDTVRCPDKAHGPFWISDKTSYRKISWNLAATRFVFRMVRSLWNLMWLSSFKAMRWLKISISHRDIVRSYDKTSYWILNGAMCCLSDRQIYLIQHQASFRQLS